MRAAPITLAEANRFVEAFHRHNGALLQARFAIAALDDEGMVRGVAVARSWPAKAGDNGTLEVSRVCTDGMANACSFLYARCVRAARALGYAQLVTYTQADEDGTSLKASGWKRDGITEPRLRQATQRASMARGTRFLTASQNFRAGATRGAKVRWRVALADPLPPIVWPSEVLGPDHLTLFDEGGATA